MIHLQHVNFHQADEVSKAVNLTIVSTNYDLTLLSLHTILSDERVIDGLLPSSGNPFFSS